MNPILLKTLITLAASNNKSAKGGTVGTDAQLKNRTVLYPDEAVDLPEWGISGLPAMILGAAPQTCLFVSDLSTDGETEDAPSGDADSGDDDATAPSPEIASFSLTLKCPPEADSTLHARTIVWQLSVPIAGYRDVQTSSNSASVHAPVIKTRMVLRGVERVVNIGLLEMAGLDQPLLVGQDALADKFLIRPDRPASDKSPKAPSVDLNADVKSDDEAKAKTSDTSSAGNDDEPETSDTPSDAQEAPNQEDAAASTETEDATTDEPSAQATTASSEATAPDSSAAETNANTTDGKPGNTEVASQDAPPSEPDAQPASADAEAKPTSTDETATPPTTTDSAQPTDATPPTNDDTNK
ncbi:MAG: hypothetical protein ACMZ66_11760 [Thalassospira sp.]|uniref:hypothetical protein n=1 Tax=Thalassospira sp. TaxID=1912094 RepID=UPI003A8818C8